VYPGQSLTGTITNDFLLQYEISQLKKNQVILQIKRPQNKIKIKQNLNLEPPSFY
jgi:hypothetical protein